MTAEPQFEHKNPGLSEELPGVEIALRRRPTDLYNGVVISWMREAWPSKAWGNDVLSFGLMALLDRGVAAGNGRGDIRIRQMGIPQ
jgi:hypothetical protein